MRKKSKIKTILAIIISNQFLILSFMLILGGMTTLILSKCFFLNLIENSNKEKILSDTLFAAEILENQITRITATSPEINTFSVEQDLLDKNFILASRTNLTNHKTIFNFAKDLINSTKLLNSDQMDLIEEKIIIPNISRSDLIYLQNNLRSEILKIDFDKKSDFRVSNISHILLKPTILISKYERKNGQLLSYVYLSDFLSKKNAINYENNFILVNMEGELIASLNTGKVIFTDTIINKSSFKKILNLQAESGLFMESNGSEERLISYCKLKNLDLILINLYKFDILNQNTNFVIKRINFYSIILFIILEIIIIFALYLKRSIRENI